MQICFLLWKFTFPNNTAVSANFVYFARKRLIIVSATYIVVNDNRKLVCLAVVYEAGLGKF